MKIFRFTQRQIHFLHSTEKNHVDYPFNKYFRYPMDDGYPNSFFQSYYLPPIGLPNFIKVSKVSIDTSAGEMNTGSIPESGHLIG